MTLVVDIIGPGAVPASEVKKFNEKHFGKKQRSKPTDRLAAVPPEGNKGDDVGSFTFGGAEISPTHISSRHKPI